MMRKEVLGAQNKTMREGEGNKVSERSGVTHNQCRGEAQREDRYGKG